MEIFTTLMNSIMAGNVIPGFKVEQGPCAQISISIPKTHPKAESLINLAKLLATQQTLKSGVIINKGANDESISIFLKALRECGVDTDALLADLKKQQLDSISKVVRETPIADNPGIGAHLLLGALDEGMPHSISPSLLNRVEELKKTNEWPQKSKPIDL